MENLVISKDSSDLFIEKEENGSVTIGVSFQDTMDYRTNQITLNREQVLEILETLQKMV